MLSAGVGLSLRKDRRAQGIIAELKFDASAANPVNDHFALGEADGYSCLSRLDRVRRRFPACTVTFDPSSAGVAAVGPGSSARGAGR